ncbi:MAG: hypothetical protein AABX29_04930 [Nanoarchaeota archaeon]
MERIDESKITQELLNDRALEDIANNSNTLHIHDTFWKFFCPACSLFGAFIAYSTVSDIPFVQEMPFFYQYSAKIAVSAYGFVHIFVCASMASYVDERRILAREISERLGRKVSIFGEYTSFA